MSGGENGLLMSSGSSGLLGADESRSDPCENRRLAAFDWARTRRRTNGGSTEGESHGDGSTVVDTSSGDDLNLLAGEGRLSTGDEFDAGGDENRRGDISSVSSSLSTYRRCVASARGQRERVEGSRIVQVRTLSADDIDSDGESLLAVLDGSDHVHNEDVGGVESVDDLLRGYTDGADEEGSLLSDDDVDELVELSSSVCERVVMSRGSRFDERLKDAQSLLVFRADPPT